MLLAPQARRRMCSACEALEFLLGDVSRVPIKHAVVIGCELMACYLLVALVDMSSMSIQALAAYAAVAGIMDVPPLDSTRAVWAHKTAALFAT